MSTKLHKSKQDTDNGQNVHKSVHANQCQLKQAHDEWFTPSWG